MNEQLERLGHVARVLSKHGLSGILVKIGLSYTLPFLQRTSTHVPQDLPARIRAAFEELGGAYIKLGQMLSLRPDLVTPAFSDEFAKLLDEIPPEPIETVTSVIEQEFSKPADTLFSYIDPRPLGSASVAQVHKATLRDGTLVAVKILRPHIAAQFSADIALMHLCANKLEKHFPNTRPTLIVEEFERYTKQELNFITEASHLEEIRKSIHTRNVIVPKVYWNLTTKRVLAMQYLDGTKLSELDEANKPAVALLLMDALFDQIFRGKEFHADLHPGNVLLLKSGKIGLLDFGIVGHLTEQTQKLGLALYLAILEKNSERIAEVLVRYAIPSSDTDLPTFKQDVENLVTTWSDDSPEKQRITHLMHNLFILCTKHKLLLPRDTILLGKALVTAEATARKLDPSFNFIAYSEPRIAQLLKEQRAPAKVISRFTKQSRAFIDAFAALPSKTLQAVESIQQGRLSVILKDNQFRHLGQDINLSSNRVSFSLIAAALIMGGAITINIGPRVGSYSLLSMLSYGIALIFVLALFISLAREQNPAYDPHD